MSNLATIVPPSPQWICNSCGGTTLASKVSCNDCGTVRPVGNRKRVQQASPIDSSGANMVQNNVTNIQVDGGMAFSDAYYEPRSEPSNEGSSLMDAFHKFFLFTCTVAFWTGIFVVLGVMLAIFALVIRATL